MSGSSHTEFSGPTRAVNTGPGDMYVTFTAENLLKTPPAARRRVAESQLRHLQQQFSRPVHISAAYDVLESRNMLFLDGEPGSGRSSAARVLLRELPRGTGTYHELTTESDDGKAPRLSADMIGEQDQMLFDLSAANERLWNAVQAQLWDFHHALQSKHAHLAVVLPRLRQDQLAPEFLALRKKIGPPDRLDVIIRHLRCGGLDTRICDPSPPALLTFVETRPPMRELARLAVRILEMRAAGREGDTFGAWCERAVAEQTDRGPEVAELVPHVRKGPQRALLLSSALLHGARAEAVHRATASLLSVVKSPVEARPLLEHPGLDERLEKIDAVWDGTSRVRFERRGFARAVRRHFWTTRPDLREPLRAWVSEILGLSELADADRERLVHRFTELCLSTEDTGELIGLVKDWTSAPTQSDRLRAAAQLLAQSIPSEACGGAFRQQIYEWSKQRQLSDGLRRVLAEVCEKVMAVRHPEAALVRLHHLARHEQFPGIARETLLRYVTNDPEDLRLHRRLLYRLTVSSSDDHRRPDTDLFLELTAPTSLPRPFLRSSTTRGWLTTGWAAAFDHAGPERWAACAETWISAADATEDPAIAGRLFDVLVAAAETRYAILSRLYASARERTRPELSTLLLRKINEAQTTRLSRDSTTPRQREAAPS
ncbi:hypothetical protein ABZ837_07200 [Streptomyces sp. NPDC047197]|uniref:hypothetical protein n=1 Tax=Streptomyces sp. NPDC047197 TaxID=3155477 RepID=UPI0033DAE4FC